MSTVDYEPIFNIKNEQSNDDNGYNKSNIKVCVLLFILFIILSTDVFTDQILSKFNGATSMGVSTSTGVIIQGIFLVIGYILIDLLCRSEIL